MNNTKTYSLVSVLSMIEQPRPFALTIERPENGRPRRIWSNFMPPIRAIFGRGGPVPSPKAPGQASLDRFKG
jgi:hypothetical protein